MKPTQFASLPAALLPKASGRSLSAAALPLISMGVWATPFT